MTEPEKKNPHATALSRLGAAKGGQARAKRLSAQRRKEIAQQAAEARWADHVSEIPRAAYGSPDRPLRVGELEIPCYVLDDERRVLVQRGMMTALDMSQGTAGKGSGDRLAKFISTRSISPFVSNELRDVIIHPIRFKGAGATAYGYEATVLADLCDAVLAARKAKQLHHQQEHIADSCEMLVRAFAKVGIIALVDEATGYQDVRDRQALQAILDKYLRSELAAWAKRFPDEFYKQIFRLRGWKWRGMSVNRPQVVAQYTKDIVYERLAPGILEELEERNPRGEKGYRPAKHHQWLTEDVGHPALAQHIYAVIGLMRVSESWKQFQQHLNLAYPKRGQTLTIPWTTLHDSS